MRTLWLANIVLFAVIISTGGGILSWIGGMNPANAILAGAGAFAGVVVLALTVAHFLTDPHQAPREPKEPVTSPPRPGKGDAI